MNRNPSPETLGAWTYGRLIHEYPYAEDFFKTRGIPLPLAGEVLAAYVLRAEGQDFLEKGILSEDLLPDLISFLTAMESIGKTKHISTLEIRAGRSKTGDPEAVASLTAHVGDVISVVGPTGSGKSRLLEDIECLAQGDTPSGRRILLDGEAPDSGLRFSLDRKLVAQISQNMNFVMDCSALDFVILHSESRMVAQPAETAREILALANELAGERFSETTALTSLSGGQSRALMIADTAFLSQSPIVLIDEIENAGVDRRKALDLLVRNEKIVFLATHDPLLALMADRRVIINQGSMTRLIKKTPQEFRMLQKLKEADALLMGARDQLRRGDLITL